MPDWKAIEIAANAANDALRAHTKGSADEMIAACLLVWLLARQAAEREGKEAGEIVASQINQAKDLRGRFVKLS